jgi:hypothetical protein
MVRLEDVHLCKPCKEGHAPPCSQRAVMCMVPPRMACLDATLKREEAVVCKR